MEQLCSHQSQTCVLRAQNLMATKKEEPRTDTAVCNEKGLWSGAFIGKRRCMPPVHHFPPLD